MQSSTSIWVPIGGISGIVSAAVAVLIWAGITPKSLLSWKLPPLVKADKTRTALAVVLAAISFVLVSGTLYISLHPLHPILSWVIVGAVFLLAAAIWFGLKKQSSPIFDAELYRIVSSPKNAFAGMAKQLIESMGHAFALDIDILLEMYLVNEIGRAHV